MVDWWIREGLGQLPPQRPSCSPAQTTASPSHDWDHTTCLLVLGLGPGGKMGAVMEGPHPPTLYEGTPSSWSGHRESLSLGASWDAGPTLFFSRLREMSAPSLFY